MEYVWGLLFVCLTLLSTYAPGYLIVQDDHSSSEDGHGLGLKQRMHHLEATLAKLQETTEHRNNCSETNALKACPDGWLQHRGSCYYFGRENINFEKAKEFCKDLTAHLVHVETNTEDAFLKNFLKTFTDRVVPVHFWLGLTDTDTEGVWRWYDDGSKAAYFGWVGTEPQDAGGAEDCAIFEAGQEFAWADIPCGSSFRAMCEQKFKSA